MKRTIEIVAGPNGSGKTTFAETFIVGSKPTVPFLNPDIIAAGFGASDPEKASFQAGRVLLTEIKAKIQKGDSFAFESTLSGLTYAALIEHAKRNNYKIVIHFIFLKKVAHNISRIKKRVSEGGHDIPLKIVKRRYLRCFQNFWSIYRPLANEWAILDNTGIKPKLILTSKRFESMKEIDKVAFAKNFIKGAI